MADEVIGSAKWDLDLDSKKFNDGVASSKNKINDLTDHLERARTGSLAFAGALAALGAGLVAFGFSSVKAYDESERVNAQLDAVLKSTKDTTQATAAHAVTVGVSTTKHAELEKQLATAKDRLDNLSHSHAKGEDAVYKHNKAVTEVTANIASLEAQLNHTSTSMVGGYIPRVQMSRDALIALSKEIQRTTTIGDEAALSAINMGLTFTAIGKDIFPSFTKAVVDTAYAMNSGMKPSAEQLADTTKQLGKALQDPENGLGALHRVGVNTDELTKKFKTVTDTAERQKLIIKELNTEFGGSGAAQLNTFGGQLDHVREIFKDFQELIGRAIENRLKPLGKAFDKWMDAMGGPDGMLKSLKNTLGEIVPLLPLLIGLIIGGLIPSLETLLTLALIPLISSFIALLPFIAVGGLIGLGIMGIINALGGWQNAQALLKVGLDLLILAFQTYLKPALDTLWQTIQTQLLPQLQELWRLISPVLKPVLEVLALVIMGVVIVALRAFIEILIFLITKFSEMVAFVNSGITTVKNLFAGLPGFLQNAVSGIRNIIVKPFEDAWGAIQGLMNKIKDALDFTKRHSPSVLDIVSHGVDLVNKEFQSLADITVPSVAHMLSDRTQPAQAGSTQDIDIHIGQVNSNQDVQAIGREIGFRAGLMPR